MTTRNVPCRSSVKSSIAGQNGDEPAKANERIGPRVSLEISTRLSCEASAVAVGRNHGRQCVRFLQKILSNTRLSYEASGST